jgi:asparagine synthase (glutamine-hydrolysing)
MLDSFGYLNTKVIRQMWNEHVSGKMKHTGRLWGVLMFISWHLDQIH